MPTPIPVPPGWSTSSSILASVVSGRRPPQSTGLVLRLDRPSLFGPLRNLVQPHIRIDVDRRQVFLVAFQISLEPRDVRLREEIRVEEDVPDTTAMQDEKA